MKTENKRITVTTEPNKDLGDLLTKEHKIIDGTNPDKVTVIKLGHFTIKDEGQTLTLIDVMREAQEYDIKIEGMKNQVRTLQDTLGEHMVMIAEKAKDADQLEAAFKVAEESLRWGRAPAGLTPKERAMYTGELPSTYKSYKSMILTAMRNGVIPGKTYAVTRKLPKPKKDGSTEVIDQKKAITPHTMKTIGKDLIKKAEAEAKPRGNQAGVQVNPDGTQDLIQDTKTMAAMVDLDIVETVGGILEGLAALPEKERTVFFNRLVKMDADIKARLAKLQEKAAA